MRSTLTPDCEPLRASGKVLTADPLPVIDSATF